MNLADAKLESSEHGNFTSHYGVIGEHIGAKKLGYSLTVLPAGKRVCPFHNHRHDEEMFLILEGTGELRFGDQVHQVRPNDVIACPPGGREVAHQIINTGSVEMRYLSLSTVSEIDVCEYPDSDKINVMVGEGPGSLHKVFRAGSAVPYFDGEKK